MNKLALSAAVAALALSPVFAAQAQDASQSVPTYGANVNPNWQDNFFVAGQLGQTQARSAAFTHDNGVFQNVRFGWRWNGIIGAELGYVYLGRPKAEYDGLASTSAKPRAGTVGVNAKYNVYEGLYVTAHAGYMRSNTRFDTVVGPYHDTDKTWNNGVYAGLGVGYDLTKNVSVSVNYDDYRVQAGNDNIGRIRYNVAAYSAGIEYRF